MATENERKQHEREARSYAEAAVKDLERRTGAGHLQNRGNHLFSGKYRTIGESIISRYRSEGGICYIGERVETPEKLAALMQSYRNPLFETLRFFYLKDCRVIDAESYSSHLPNCAMLPFSGEICAAYIDERMRLLGADGYYMVHNHPSGNPTPSHLDQQLTLQLAHHTKGYLGHIVTNHVRYALLDRDAEYEIHQMELDMKDPFAGASVSHPLLGEVISTSSALANVGRELQIVDNDSVSVMVYIALTNAVVKIQEISNVIFADPAFTDWLREEMFAIGAVRCCCITSDEEVYDHAEELIRQRYMMDMVYLDADYPFYWSKRESGIKEDSAYLYAGMKSSDIKIIYQGEGSQLINDFVGKTGTSAAAWDKEPEWTRTDLVCMSRPAVLDGFRTFGSRDISEGNDLEERWMNQWIEQVNELSYKDQFKLVLAMEFPEITGKTALQDDLYTQFMEDEHETGFFGSDFRKAAEEKIASYQKEQQKELDTDDDFLCV